MSFVIGIDGGGTKTLAKAADMDGNILSCCEGGPSNINSAGIPYVENVIKTLVEDTLNKANLSIKDCRSICMGTAGADRTDDKRIIEGILKSTGAAGSITVTNDAEIALYGGTGCGEGVIVISGTGSICYGRSSDGKTCRAGGWGHIIGDEGSGYDIGVRALKCIMGSFDGRRRGTMLTSMILDFLDLESPQQLVQYVYRSGAGKKEIAALAEIVDSAFRAGDGAAEEILRCAAYELYICTTPVIQQLGFSDKAVQIVVNGSVLVKNKYVLGEFSSLIHNSYPMAGIGYVKDDPAWGAVLVALDKIRDLEGDYVGKFAKA